MPDPTVVIAVDPGVHACGVACYVRGALTWAMLTADPSAVSERIAGPCAVIVERPEHQGGRSLLARPKDLMDLAWAGAKFAYSIGAPVREISPGKWKGSVPKPQHHARLLTVLSPQEIAVLPPGAQDAISRAVLAGARDRWAKPGASYYGRNTVHNVLDAVALGAFATGRLKP